MKCYHCDTTKNLRPISTCYYCLACCQAGHAGPDIKRQYTRPEDWDPQELAKDLLDEPVRRPNSTFICEVPRDGKIVMWGKNLILLRPGYVVQVLMGDHPKCWVNLAPESELSIILEKDLLDYTDQPKNPPG